MMRFGNTNRLRSRDYSTNFIFDALGFSESPAEAAALQEQYRNSTSRQHALASASLWRKLERAASLQYYEVFSDAGLRDSSVVEEGTEAM